MELKQFIKNALKDITEAVDEVTAESKRDMHLDSLKEQRTVEFDVAVTAEDITSASGKAGIKVFSIIEGGGETSKEVKNSSASRIKFGVYVDRWTKQQQANFDIQNQQFNDNDNYR
jgi:hypothetical protein